MMTAVVIDPVTLDTISVVLVKRVVLVMMTARKVLLARRQAMKLLVKVQLPAVILQI